MVGSVTEEWTIEGGTFEGWSSLEWKDVYSSKTFSNNQHKSRETEEIILSIIVYSNYQHYIYNYLQLPPPTTPLPWTTGQSSS